MANKADGTIYINTKIDTEGFTAGEKQVENAARRMANTVTGLGDKAKLALQKMADAFVKQNQAYAQQEQKVESLKEKLKDMESQKIETEEYKKLTAEMEKLDAEMEKISEKQRNLISIGISEEDAYKTVAEDLERVGAAMDKVIAKQREMRENGTAYATPDTSQTEQNLAAAEQRLAQMNASLGTSYESLRQKVAAYNEETLNTAKNNLKKNISGIVATVKKCAAAFLLLNKNAKKTNGTMGSSLVTILKYSLGIRGLYALFSRMRSAASEGFQNLAQYSGETNASISSLVSSLTQLKNSFATAFAPILNVVAPILTTFINLISRAVTYVGMLIAALSGKSSFAKAVGVQQDYAASLNNTASSAQDAADATKDAEKATSDYLSGLDEINRYTADDKSTGGSAGGGGGYSAPTAADMFETVQIDQSINSMADKLKEVFENIFTPFKQAWEQEGQKTIEVAKYAFNNLGALATSVGKSMMEVWTNGTGTQILSTMLQIAQNLFTIVGNVAARLSEAWNTAGVGTAIIQNIANAFQSVLDFINRIATATAVWSANLNFYPLLQSIASLTESLSPLIQMIGSILGWIYESIILPMAKYLIETALPFIITKISELFNFLSENQWIVEAIGIALVSAFAAAKIGTLITTIIGFVSSLIAVLGGGGGLSGVISGIVATLGGPLTIAIAAVIAAGVLLYKNWDKVKETALTLWKKVFKPFAEYIKSGFVKVWIEILKPAFEYIGDTVIPTVISIFEELWDDVLVPLGRYISATFEPIVKTLSDTFGSFYENVIKPLASFIGDVFSTTFEALATVLKTIVIPAASGIVDAFGWISDVFTEVVSFLSDVLKPAFEVLGSVIDTLKGAFDTFATAVSNAFSGITAAVKEPINAVIGFINKLITKINGFINKVNNAFTFDVSFTNPFTGQKVGFWHTMDIPTINTIPYLATGAVIPPNAPFTAVLGDQKHGTNIETPEALLRKIVREESGGNGFSGEIRIPITLNGRTLFEAIIDEAMLARVQSGRNPFEMA